MVYTIYSCVSVLFAIGLSIVLIGNFADLQDRPYQVTGTVVTVLDNSTVIYKYGADCTYIGTVEENIITLCDNFPTRCGKRCVSNGNKESLMTLGICMMGSCCIVLLCLATYIRVSSSTIDIVPSDNTIVGELSTLPDSTVIRAFTPSVTHTPIDHNRIDVAIDISSNN